MREVQFYFEQKTTTTKVLLLPNSIMHGSIIQTAGPDPLVGRGSENKQNGSQQIEKNSNFTQNVFFFLFFYILPRNRNKINSNLIE